VHVALDDQRRALLGANRLAAAGAAARDVGQ